MKNKKIRHIITATLILSVAVTQLGLIIHTHCCPETIIVEKNASDHECCSSTAELTQEDCCTTRTKTAANSISDCNEHCYETCYIGNDYIKLELDQIVKEKEKFKEYFVLIADLTDFDDKAQSKAQKDLVIENDDLPCHLWGKNLVIYLHKEKTPDLLLA